MAHPVQLGLQDATSPVIEELITFHDQALIAIFLISFLILYALSSTLTTKLTNTNITDAQEIETIWTILPAVILILIALPSLRILYMTDEINNPSFTIKSIGHQWYWTYEYTDYGGLIFNSYILPLWPSTSRSWQPSGPPNWSPSPYNNYISRRTTLMNYPHTRPKNRRSAWTPEPNRIYSHTTRRLLWTMLRNLRRKPQLHTNRRRADSTKNLWNRTCVHPITPITLCRPTVQLFQH